MSTFAGSWLSAGLCYAVVGDGQDKSLMKFLIGRTGTGALTIVSVPGILGYLACSVCTLAY